MHGHEPSVARCLILACTVIYAHSVCVCWVGVGEAVMALVRLPACAATPKRWRLIDYTISNINLMSLPIFTKQPCYY